MMNPNRIKILKQLLSKGKQLGKKVSDKTIGTGTNAWRKFDREALKSPLVRETAGAGFGGLAGYNLDQLEKFFLEDQGPFHLSPTGDHAMLLSNIGFGAALGSPTIRRAIMGKGELGSKINRLLRAGILKGTAPIGIAGLDQGAQTLTNLASSSKNMSSFFNTLDTTTKQTGDAITNDFVPQLSTTLANIGEASKATSSAATSLAEIGKDLESAKLGETTGSIRDSLRSMSNAANQASEAMGKVTKVIPEPEQANSAIKYIKDFLEGARKDTKDIVNKTGKGALLGLGIGIPATAALLHGVNRSKNRKSTSKNKRNKRNKTIVERPSRGGNKVKIEIPSDAVPEGFYSSILGNNVKTAFIMGPDAINNHPAASLNTPTQSVNKAAPKLPAGPKVRRPISGYTNLLSRMLGLRDDFNLKPYQHMDASPNPFYDIGVTGPYINQMKEIRSKPILGNPFAK